NNFRIGFGTFIDKKMLPFFDNADQFGDRPTDSCQLTYSFCNTMNLTEDGKETFLDSVGSASVGVNKDSPEGGMDGL
ncbi:hypothetical protein GUF49_16100, partial [Xanthomonas citri pv. citri]|nr:hypothetical protein [Xanthomonas citri pv. citri]